MSQQKVGVLGCVSLAAAVVLAVAVVFFEQAIVAVGLPFHFFNFSLLAAALFVVALVCGYNARKTTPGKLALIGGLALGVVFVGFFALVLIAFSYH